MYIINAFHCRAGGGKQIALSLINYIIENGQMKQFMVILNEPLKKELGDLSKYQDNFFTIEDDLSYLGKLKKFKMIENKIKPPAVLSIFGPTFWKPKAFHIVGFAKPQIVYEKEYLSSNALSSFAKIKFRLKYTLQKWLFMANSDCYIVESDDVNLRLRQQFGLKESEVITVSNTFNQLFNGYENRISEYPNYPTVPFRLLAIGTNYPHKNFSIIRKILPLIIEQNINVKFYVTFSEQEYKDSFSGFEEFVINLGVLSVKECIEAYKNCDALFLPTLLECFSASWPESMMMGLPILTSDRSFSKSICGEAGIYFDPLSPIDVVDKIQLLVKDRELYNRKIEEGKLQLKKIPSAVDRAERYLKILKKQEHKS